jgi:hypothetical protein
MYYNGSLARGTNLANGSQLTCLYPFTYGSKRLYQKIVRFSVTPRH